MESKSRIQVLVALIGLASAIGVAVFSNWDKIFPPERVKPPEESAVELKVPTMPPPPQQPPPPESQKQQALERPSTESEKRLEELSISEQRQVAEKFAADWLDALLGLDVSKLVEMAEIPFYFNTEFLVRKADLADRYTGYHKFFSLGRYPAVQIRSVKANTILELKKQGVLPPREESLFQDLHLGDEDFTIYIAIDIHFAIDNSTGRLAMSLFTHKIGTDLKLAGFTFRVIGKR